MTTDDNAKEPKPRLNKREWAWEYLRCNRDFHHDWQRARDRREFETVSAAEGLKVTIAHKRHGFLDR